MVACIREPENPYDANAVRVENILGEKVGHLRRELALEIAPLLDSGDLQIEGGGGAVMHKCIWHLTCAIHML